MRDKPSLQRKMITKFKKAMVADVFSRSGELHCRAAETGGTRWRRTAKRKQKMQRREEVVYSGRRWTQEGVNKTMMKRERMNRVLFNLTNAFGLSGGWSLFLVFVIRDVASNDATRNVMVDLNEA